MAGQDDGDGEDGTGGILTVREKKGVGSEMPHRALPPTLQYSLKLQGISRLGVGMQFDLYTVLLEFLGRVQVHIEGSCSDLYYILLCIPNNECR